MKMFREIALVIGATLLLPVMLIAQPGTQDPAAKITTFQSDHHSVTMERFDPKAVGLHPAVIVVHGAGGPPSEWRTNGLIGALTDGGFVAFVPHYFEGNGGE